ncbi:hypothetical protein DV515_00019874, partial [Chloebia gouldiae]
AAQAGHVVRAGEDPARRPRIPAEPPAPDQQEQIQEGPAHGCPAPGQRHFAQPEARGGEEEEGEGGQGALSSITNKMSEQPPESVL